MQGGDEPVEDVALRHQQLVDAERADEGDEHAQPPTITSARASSNPGLWIRSASRSVASVRNTSSMAVRREREVVDQVAVVLGHPELDRADRGDGAGQADHRLGLRATAGTSRDEVLEPGRRLGDGVAQLLRPPAGRWSGASR